MERDGHLAIDEWRKDVAAAIYQLAEIIRRDPQGVAQMDVDTDATETHLNGGRTCHATDSGVRRVYVTFRIKDPDPTPLD